MRRTSSSTLGPRRPRRTAITAGARVVAWALADDLPPQTGPLRTARSTVGPANPLDPSMGARGADMRGAKTLLNASLALLAGMGVVVSAGSAAADAPAPAATASPSPAVPVANNHVRDVQVHAADGGAGGTEIEIVGTGAPTYNVRGADGGRRLLVDLADTDVAGAPAAITTPVGVVGGVLTQGFDTNVGHMTRLSISLLRAASYRVIPQGTSLRVALTPSGASEKATAAAGPAPTPTPSPPTALVRDVRFERAPSAVAGCAPDGCDRVVVDLGSIPAYSLVPGVGGALKLLLRQTALPETLARTLDVTRYEGALRSITASYDKATGTTTLELARAGEAPGPVSVDGGNLIWSFPTPRTNGRQPSPIAQIHLDGRTVSRDGGPARPTVTVARESEPQGLQRIETSIHDEDQPQVETSGGGAAGFAATAGAGLLGQTR